MIQFKFTNSTMKIYNDSLTPQTISYSSKNSNIKLLQNIIYKNIHVHKHYKLFVFLFEIIYYFI